MRSYNFLGVLAAILLLAGLQFVDIQISFRSNGTNRWNAYSTNETSTFSNQSIRFEKIQSSNTTVSASQEKCTPPLAKLSHCRNRLDDPRIGTVEAEKIIQVACEFQGTPDIRFPHAMQQLYRCFSYWQDYQTMQHYMLIPDEEVDKKLRVHPFISGMMELFQEQVEVDFYLNNVFGQKAVDQLRKSQNVDIQAFNGIGNFSLRHAHYLHFFTKEQLKLDDTSSDTCKHPKPRIAILDRNYKSGRSMLNAAQLAKRLEIMELSRNHIVNVKNFESADFREQVTFFRSVDILISPHGPQLTGVAFINAPCSHVLELFREVRFVFLCYFSYFGSE